MKITLRKRDSVTSSVIFIYNMLNEYNGKQSIKLSHLIDFMQRFGKSESSIRTGLSRMVKSGILYTERINGETIYNLTDDGMQNIITWNKGLQRFFQRYQMRFTDWDRKWQLLSIFDFNKSEYENQTLLDEFMEMGLRESNNIWITPYKIEEEILQQLKSKGYRYMIFKGDILNVGMKESLIKEYFKIDYLKTRYQDFISKIETFKIELSSKSNIDVLPILFEIGWDFYDLVTTDPVPPKAIIGEWEEDEAVKLMQTIRKELFTRVTGVFKEREL